MSKGDVKITPNIGARIVAGGGGGIRRLIITEFVKAVCGYYEKETDTIHDRLLDVFAPHLLTECSTFVNLNKKLQHDEGKNDDGVFGGAHAWWCHLKAPRATWHKLLEVNRPRQRRRKYQPSNKITGY